MNVSNVVYWHRAGCLPISNDAFRLCSACCNLQIYHKNIMFNHILHSEFFFGGLNCNHGGVYSPWFRFGAAMVVEINPKELVICGICGMWYVVCVACGMWHVACGMWYHWCGMWYKWFVVCGMWYVVYVVCGVGFIITDLDLSYGWFKDKFVKLVVIHTCDGGGGRGRGAQRDEGSISAISMAML